MENIPLFIKDGGIVPMMPPVRQTSEWKNDTPLSVRVYGKAAGTFILYDDDGRSFGFRDGRYTRKRLTVADGQEEVLVLDEDGPWSYGELKWVYMTTD
jgi:alpha-D-xyloside xylohydrolase